jgi:hypothetical protein
MHLLQAARRQLGLADQPIRDRFDMDRLSPPRPARTGKEPGEPKSPKSPGT